MADHTTSAATADTDEPTVMVGTEPDAMPGDTGQPALTGGGKAALAAERDARRTAEKKIRDLETKIAGMEAEKLRSEIATAKGVPAEFLVGETREDLEARADALLAFRGSGPAEQEQAKRPTRSLPAEVLRSGAAPADTEGFDARKTADKIFSNR